MGNQLKVDYWSNQEALVSLVPFKTILNFKEKVYTCIQASNMPFPEISSPESCKMVDLPRLSVPNSVIPKLAFLK